MLIMGAALLNIITEGAHEVDSYDDENEDAKAQNDHFMSDFESGHDERDDDDVED